MYVSPYIFREYDIRGIVGKDLTNEVAELIGKAVGTHLKTKTVLIGMDCRLSSPELKESMLKGLLSTGKKVVDVGILPTPVFYFGSHLFDIDGGVMVTGSHNPPDFNGFKIVRNKRAIFGEEIRGLRKIIESESFISGAGSVETKEIIDDYKREVLKRIKKGKRKLRIGIDAGNGVVGPVILPILHKLDCEVHKLFCEPDGNFPNHFPDPIVPDNLKWLIEEVKGKRLDFGVAFDGDGDRIGVIDDRGNIIWGDILIAIFAREVLKENKGAKVVVEVKCSEALIEDIVQHGGKAIMWKAGHSLIENKIHEEKAPLGGEMSGHIYFTDRYYGYDDAMYACVRLIEIMQQTERKLSEIVETIPHYYTSPEIRMEYPDELKFEVVEKIKSHYEKKGNRIIDIDGARIYFDNGWALIRASNTQPALVLRFESNTEEGLKRISDELSNTLKEYKK